MYKPRNRHMAAMAKRGTFWCTRCDRSLVGQWGKCPICGNKEHKHKKKGF